MDARLSDFHKMTVIDMLRLLLKNLNQGPVTLGNGTNFAMKNLGYSCQPNYHWKTLIKGIASIERNGSQLQEQFASNEKWLQMKNNGFSKNNGSH